MQHKDTTSLLIKEIQTYSDTTSPRTIMDLFSGDTDSKINKKLVMYMARQTANWDCIDWLIRGIKKANENDEANFGELLVLAAKEQRIGTVKLLLEAGAPTHVSIDDDEYKSLHWAVKHKNKGMIALLLKYGARLTDLNKEEKTPIQLAAILEYWDCVHTIAAIKKSNDNDDERYGDAFVAAVKNDKYDLALILLQQGARTSWYSEVNKYNCLHWAVKNRNVKMIKLLLQYGASLKSVNKDKQMPIQLAADLEYWDCVEAIADNKDDKLHTANYGYALLSSVAKKVPLSTVKSLIQAKAAMSWSMNESGNSILQEAVSTENNLEVLELLLSQESNLAWVNKKKETVIHIAAANKEWAYVKAIAQSKETDEDDMAGYGAAIMPAINAGEISTVEALLNAKAPLTWIDKENENTCLHQAVIRNNPKMIDLLLEYEADEYKKNKEGQTPLEYACILGNWASAAALMKNKKFRFKDGSEAGFAFIAAIKAGQIHVAKYLKNAGASIKGKTRSDNFTALHWAVNQNDHIAVQYLLGECVSQIVVSAQGETPVELACRLGHWQCAEKLIQHDSAEGRKDKSDLHYENALLHAIKAGHYDTVELLLKHNAPCKKTNEKEWGNIALCAAVQTDKCDIKTKCKMISLLIAYNANPNVKNKAGKTIRDLVKELELLECIKAIDNKEKEKSNLDISTLVDKRDKLFHSLMENAVDFTELAQTISSFSVYQNLILKKVRGSLEEKRNKLKDATPVWQSTHATFLATQNGEPGKIGSIITTINTLLQYPDSPVSNKEWSIIANDNSFEADHLMTILTQKQNIDIFVAAIKTWLLEMKKTILETRWKVRNYKPWSKEDWVDGTPEHISFIAVDLKLLDNINVTNSVVLHVFTEVASILYWLDNSVGRHPDTVKFYRDKCTEYKLLNFPAVIEAYSQKKYESYVNEQIQTAMLKQYAPVFYSSDPVQTYYSLYPDLSMYNNGSDFSPYPLATLPPTYQEAISQNYRGVNAPLYPVTYYNPAPVNIPLISENYDFIQAEERNKIELPLELFVTARKSETENVYQKNDDITFFQAFPKVPVKSLAPVRQQENAKVLAM